MVAETSSDAINLHELLTGNQRYQMPLFQRKYEWRQDTELTRLWDDITRVLEGSTDTAFLGAIVIQLETKGTSGKSQVYTVIDGQQRITTFYILLCALVKSALDHGWDDIASDIADQYLLIKLMKEKNHTKVVPTLPDNKQFNFVISHIKEPKAKLLPAHGADRGFMIDSFNYHLQRIEEIITTIGDGNPTDSSAIELIIEAITEKIEIVQISLTKSHDANEVFDRLNTGGRPLRVIDLVRNEMFQNVSTDYDAAENLYISKWKPFEDKFFSSLAGLEQWKQDSIIDGFFFPYTLCNNSNARKNRILEELKELWESVSAASGPEKAEAIIDHMDRFRAPYLALEQASRPDGIDNSVWSALLRLRKVPLPSVTYPFLMRLIDSTMIGDLSPSDAESCVKIIEAFLVRRGLAGLEPTGLHAIFKKLWDRSKGNPEKVFQHIQSGTIWFPSDDELIESVTKTKMYGKKVGRFIIEQYEEHLQDKSLEPLKSLPDITIDHVMPQSRTGEWKTIISEEDHERLVDTWGNLVPLSSKANSVKNAKSYEQAKCILSEETKFNSTKRVLAEHDTWGVNEIEKRNLELASWAISRWPKSC